MEQINMMCYMASRVTTTFVSPKLNQATAGMKRYVKHYAVQIRQMYQVLHL